MSNIDKFHYNFVATREIVNEFAEITGDVSSLHTNETFVENSVYRKNVAHGMLPLIGLAGLPRTLFPFKWGVMRQISARFSKPIFVGDHVRVEISRDHEAGSNDEFFYDFAVKNQVNESVLTTGRVVVTSSVNLNGGTAEREVIGNVGNRSMIQGDLSEACREFAEIKVGLTEKISFDISGKSLSTMLGLIGKLYASVTKVPCLDTNEFMAMSLLSTFVGMVIPGRTATFVDFNLKFNTAALFNAKGCLSCNVKFKSESTRTISMQGSFEGNNRPGESFADARLTARIEKETAKMPGMDAVFNLGQGSLMRGKVALVTGSGRGIGETIAKTLALNGAKVAVNYMSNKQSADRVVHEIISLGLKAIAIQCDITKPEDVAKMMTQISETFGSVDILVNNACQAFFPARFEDQSWESVEKLFVSVVKGSFNCIQATLPAMKSKKWGRIVNIGTIFTELPPQNQSAYVIAKSALSGLTRTLAVECAKDGVLVNQISPSMVETDLNRSMTKVSLASEIARSPLSRLASSNDVAGAVLFLASDLAGFTTGQQIMISGGLPPFL